MTDWKDIDDVLDFWTAFDQTVTEPEKGSETDGGTTIEYLSYGGGINGTTVDLYRYVDGGHVWFDEQYAGSDASELIWDFLSGYDVDGAL